MKNSFRSFISIICATVMVFSISCSSPDKKEGSDNANAPVVLEPLEFQSKLAETQEAVLVDVRTPEEVAEGAIEGAVHIDFQDPGFAQGIDTLDRDKTYFVYCLSGKRSGDAVADMHDAGFQKIYTLKDGFRNWKDQGLGTTNPAVEE